MFRLIRYGAGPAEMVTPLQQLLTEMCSISMSSISMSSVQKGASLSDNSDLIDCFYAMLAQVLQVESIQKNILIFLQVLKKQPGLFMSQELPSSLLIQVPGLFAFSFAMCPCMSSVPSAAFACQSSSLSKA